MLEVPLRLMLHPKQIIAKITKATERRCRRWQEPPHARGIRSRRRSHDGASGSGGPPGKRNGQYRHGERTKAAIAERQKSSGLLKMLRAGLTCRSVAR